MIPPMRLTLMLHVTVQLEMPPHAVTKERKRNPPTMKHRKMQQMLEMLRMKRMMRPMPLLKPRKPPKL